MVLTDDRHAPQKDAPFNLRAYLAEGKAQVEAALDHFLPVTYPERICESMRYSPRASAR